MLHDEGAIELANNPLKSSRRCTVQSRVCQTRVPLAPPSDDQVLPAQAGHKAGLQVKVTAARAGGYVIEMGEVVTEEVVAEMMVSTDAFIRKGGNDESLRCPGSCRGEALCGSDLAEARTSGNHGQRRRTSPECKESSSDVGCR